MIRRLAEALHPNQQQREDPSETELELDAAMTFSDRERCSGMDFEKMSIGRWRRPSAVIADALPIRISPTRRYRPRSPWRPRRYAGHLACLAALRRR